MELFILHALVGLLSSKTLTCLVAFHGTSENHQLWVLSLQNFLA
jgi:hypothetical protein